MWKLTGIRQLMWKLPESFEEDKTLDKVLKVGLIGCGAIGKDHCRRIIEKVPGATVVAVASNTARSADDLAKCYEYRL